MTESQTRLEYARHDVQGLHKKICGSIAKAEEASWADVAAGQADTVKSGPKAALTTRDAAGTLVGGTRVARAAPATDGVKHAHAARLDIAISLRRAIAAARTGQAPRPFSDPPHAKQAPASCGHPGHFRPSRRISP